MLKLERAAGRHRAERGEKMFLLKFSLAIGMVSITLFASLAGGAGAAVYPQSPFHYSGFGGEYDGYCTTNLNDGHFINACHASFTSGTKVGQTTQLSGPNLRGVITPSGEVTEVVVVT
jgi:hypothetical protein